MIREALYQKKLQNNRVQCLLCPALCRLKPGKRGICHSRFNKDGRLVTDNFGETVTIAIDPIEKKPLYHFKPITSIVSIGANGCNLSCRHCQNWQISQEKVPTVYIAPEKLPGIGAQKDSIGIAYTYTEPFIWFEYILDAAPQVKKAGLDNVIVSNGYINSEPLEKLLPYIDAFNIDLKGMKPEFYKRICKGRLEPVLEVIKLIEKSPAHLELTNLIIPGLNDDDDDFQKLGEFVNSVNKTIPVHLSAYHPSYQLNNPPTPEKTMRRAYSILKKYVNNVFVGNMNIEGLADSRCPSCDQVIIRRQGYRIEMTGLDESGVCSLCHMETGIVPGN
ncbi:MAG: AmmeMemoRadiSam system radical SAM enzyme [candidate division Zixibacteria bacterium]